MQNLQVVQSNSKENKMRKLSDKDMAELIGKDWIEEIRRRARHELYVAKKIKHDQLLAKYNIKEMSFSEIFKLFQVWNNVDRNRIPNEVLVEYQKWWDICENLITAYNSSLVNIKEEEPIELLTDSIKSNCLKDGLKHQGINYIHQLHGMKIRDLYYIPCVGTKIIQKVINKWIELGHKVIGESYKGMLML